jgi:hypothetical protein
MIIKATKVIWIAFLLVVLTMGPVQVSQTALAETTISSIPVKSTTVNLTGVIKKIAVEGTCYQLVADDGQKYELIGKFPKIDGTRVQISGIEKTDLVTICQVGRPLQVKTAKIIK